MPNPASRTDQARVYANLQRMAEQGASVAEMDTYASSEGFAPQEQEAPKDPEVSWGDDGLSLTMGQGNTSEDYAPIGRPNSTMEKVSAAAGELLDGALPGSSKFIAGLGGAFGNAVRSPFTDEDFNPAAAFAGASGAQDMSQDALERDNPNVASAAWWTGLGAGIAALPAARIAQGRTLAAGVANGAATGGAYGLAAGLFNDTGDGRLSNGGLGAAAGAAIGGAFPLAGRAAGAVGRFGRRNIPGLDGAATSIGNAGRRVMGLPQAPPSTRAQAERLIGQEMADGGIAAGMGATAAPPTPRAVSAEVTRRRGMGIPAMAGDTSDQLRRLTSWALQGRGPMTTRARNSAMARQADAGRRIRGHLSETLGPAEDTVLASENITARAKQAAEGDYQAAYAAINPVPQTSELRGLMRRPAARRAVPQAYDNILNRGGNPLDQSFTITRRQPPGGGAQPEVNGGQLYGRDSFLPGPGQNAVAPAGPPPQGASSRELADLGYDVNMTETPSFESYDQVVRTMNNSIPRDGMTGRKVLDNETGAIDEVSRELDQYLRRINPQYASAKSNYADEMAIKGAMGRGDNVANLSGDEIAAQLRAMPPHAQEAWMVGARSRLASLASEKSQRPTANVAQAVRQATGLSGAGTAASLGDEAKRTAIETMAGNPGVLNRLDDRLEGEDQAYKLFSETFGNSKTAGRQALDESLTGGAGMELASKFATGNVVSAFTQLLFQGSPRGMGAYKQAVQESVAEILTETNPATVREFMAAVQRRAQTDANFGALLDRAGINLAKPAAAAAAAQDASPAQTNEPEPYPF